MHKITRLPFHQQLLLKVPIHNPDRLYRALWARWTGSKPGSIRMVLSTLNLLWNSEFNLTSFMQLKIWTVFIYHYFFVLFGAWQTWLLYSIIVWKIAAWVLFKKYPSVFHWKKQKKIWNEVSKWWQKYWRFWLNHAFRKMIAETQNTVSSHFRLVIHVSPHFTIIYLAVIYFSGKIMPFCLIFGNDILFVPYLS